jgi:hypothetical protein
MRVDSTSAVLYRFQPMATVLVALTTMLVPDLVRGDEPPSLAETAAVDGRAVMGAAHRIWVIEMKVAAADTGAPGWRWKRPGRRPPPSRACCRRR